MKILGIETSCDETAAAVVDNGINVLSNVVASSLKDHASFGGIIPEIASRRQIESISGVVSQSLVLANIDLKSIDAIAVTTKPGLIGSLLVGISFARALAYAAKKPLIEVNHIQAHWYANFLRLPNEQQVSLPTLPAVGLVVSGGHTSLFDIKDFDKVKLLGSTRDDAAGEAYDKVARLLNLGYPGGPIIDRLAKEGVNQTIRFRQSDVPNYDFSFSGLKTAVLYFTQKNKGFNVAHLAYSFQESVVGALTDKAISACRKRKAKTLLVGGGVAANSCLRERLVKAGEEQGIRVYFPPLKFCLDNAAMIAGLGYRLTK